MKFFFSVLVVLTLGSAASRAETDPRITAYLESLKASPTEVNQKLTKEILRAMELSEGPPYDALEAKRLLPEFFADLFGRNGWQSAPTPSTSFALESFFFKTHAEAFSKIDLTNAFGRTENMSSMDVICKYTEPKKGAGTRPGYKINCDGKKLKAKFKEIHTQPLATRIFWALGFNADPADYHPGLKVAYDRKIFEEFNSRTGVPLKVRFGRKEIKVATMNPHYDPFEFVASATLKDGTQIDVTTLRAKYISEKDQDLAYITTTPAQLQINLPKKARVEVGPWSFSDFDHSQSKVLRSVAVLSAWLAIYDIRRDNNLLVIDDVNGTPQLKFMFPDLGSGLGRSRYRVSLFDDIENIKHFRSSVAKRGHIRGVQVNEENDAFMTATREDFQYGVQLINQFSEVQLRELLVASGYSGSELELYLQKLISRRQSLQGL
jgi:hypothetical protein